MSCESPKTSVMSYVASDAQVLTHAPFIAQFSLTCNGKAVNDLPLYYANKADGGFVQASTRYLRIAERINDLTHSSQINKISKCT